MLHAVKTSTDEKFCQGCKTPKPVGEFYKDQAQKDGKSRLCKECTGLKNKLYETNNPGKKKDRQKRWKTKHRDRELIKKRVWNANNRLKLRASTYNITVADYERLLQKHTVCAICGNPPKGRKPLHIDHDHFTGKVRGLLCSGCNLAIGLFRENIEAMQSAIHYLKIHR